MLETGCLGWQNFTTAHLCFSASRGFPKGTVNCSLVASNDRWLTEFENSQPSVPFLWKGPPIFRGFHCLWLLLDSFFLPLTFLPHKILPPNLHFRYNCFILLNLQLFFSERWSLVVKVASLWKKIPLLLLCCSRRRDLFQFVLLECHSILVVYIASSEELLHTLLKCVSKSKGKLQRKGERERKVSFLACSADTNMRLLKFPIFRLVVTIKLGFLSERKHPTIYASVATSILRKRRARTLLEETFFVPFTLFCQLAG